jgi:hypothetical protein
VIFQELPLPRDLALSPELASLTLLDTALEVAGSALVAANPELGSVDGDDIVSGQACITEALLAHAEAMQVLIKRYAALAARHSRPDLHATAF